MYCEIYADSLFVLHFFLNLCTLAVTNHMLYGVVQRKRMFLGALLGAGCAVGTLLLPVNLLVRLLSGFLLSAAIMIKVTFGISTINEWKYVMEKMFLSTLLLGSLLLIMMKMLPMGNGMGIWKILIAEVFCYILIIGMLHKKKRGSGYKVIYLNGQEEQKTEALMDTGNTLIEPISRQPVIVVEQEMLMFLFHDEIPDLYRMIPFHSVGKEHGMLKGYFLERMLVEINGIRKEIKGIYVAVSDEIFGKDKGYKVILNPQILER